MNINKFKHQCVVPFRPKTISPARHDGTNHLPRVLKGQNLTLIAVFIEYQRNA